VFLLLLLPLLQQSFFEFPVWPHLQHFPLIANAANESSGPPTVVTAYLVIKALKKKFKPQDTKSNLEFIQALMRIKMNPKENPSRLFTQISTLQNRYGMYNTDEQHLIAVVTNVLPTEYKAIFAAERRQQAGVITFDDVEECLEDYYRQVYGSDPEDKKTVTTVGGRSLLEMWPEWTCEEGLP
jgi:hypothetical protein